MKRDLIWYGGLALVISSDWREFNHGVWPRVIGFLIFMAGALMLRSQRRDP